MTETLSPVPSVALAGAALPDEDHLARNYIGGSWRFPAAPYEYEIRNPRTSEVTAVVPLSSRLDVTAALRHARAAQAAWAADLELRQRVVLGLLDDLEQMVPQLAAWQSTEAGLEPEPSARSVRGALAVLRRRLEAPRAWGGGGAAVGVVLSWGMPTVEALLGVVPLVARGDVVVVKPSLRAPLSMPAIAHVAHGRGIPAGVLSVVQGTSLDVGAALAADHGIDRVVVRGSSATHEAVRRSVRLSGAQVEPLHGRGNVVLLGDLDEAALEDAADRLAAEILTSSGPIGAPLVLVPAAGLEAVLTALRNRLRGRTAAPVATGVDRNRIERRLLALAPGLIRAGGRIPDDVMHRMGWFVPPTLVVRDLADALAEDLVDGGPVVTLAAYDRLEDVVLDRPAHAHGVLTLVGIAADEAPLFPGLVSEATPWELLDAGHVPDAWVAGA